jgi:hypothetical protein
LLPPVYPGQRSGHVVLEARLDGGLAIRFRDHYLKYRKIPTGDRLGGSAPEPTEFSASAADAAENKTSRDGVKPSRSAGVQPIGGRSGRTPAEPYPPDGAAKDNACQGRRRASEALWRRFGKRKN